MDTKSSGNTPMNVHGAATEVGPIAVVPKSLMQSTMARFSDAWGRCDIEALMALMSDAPLYRTSSGLTFEGRDAVRGGFNRMCRPTTSPAPPGQMVFFDDKCLSYWVLQLPLRDGETQVVDGIDVITFDEDGRIRLKDAYRKVA